LSPSLPTSGSDAARQDADAGEGAAPTVDGDRASTRKRAYLPECDARRGHNGQCVPL
jgi:hypothetical protein